MQSFPKLFERIHAMFQAKRTPELVELMYDFAHWDFATYFESQHILGTLEGISADRAYLYKYDESNWAHGCVTVQFKGAVAYKGSAREAEWGPIQGAKRWVPSPDGDGQVQVDVNESKPFGVRFVIKPPDLREEPPREPFADAKVDKVVEAVRKIIEVRGDDLTPHGMAHWEALRAVHSEYREAQGVPSMPRAVQTGSNHAFQFDGLPRPLLPILRDLQRFERPFNHDLFAEPPPDAFPRGACTHALKSWARQKCKFIRECANGVVPREVMVWAQVVGERERLRRAERLSRNPERYACRVCGEYASRRCGSCRQTAYCCREHQREDWPRHRFQCVMQVE